MQPQRTLIQRLTDRSFLLTVGTLLGIVGAAMTGEITWGQAIPGMVGAIVPFILGEKYKDGKAEEAKKADTVNVATTGDVSTTPLQKANDRVDQVQSVVSILNEIGVLGNKPMKGVTRIAGAPVAEDADFSDVDSTGVIFTNEEEPLRGSIG